MNAVSCPRRAGKNTYGDYVAADLEAIDIRAITLYALSDPAVPWPLASSEIRAPFKDRAAHELWEEGALHFDPTEPYCESA